MNRVHMENNGEISQELEATCAHWMGEHDEDIEEAIAEHNFDAAVLRDVIWEEILDVCPVDALLDELIAEDL